VTTEADCSWGDDVALRLVEELRSHPEADFVIASPHLPGGGLVRVTPHRVALTRLGNRLIYAFFEPSITMNTGMTRVYRKGVIQPLVTAEDGKEFHLEVLLKLITLGFRARSATITWPERRARAGSAAARPRGSRRQWDAPALPLDRAPGATSRAVGLSHAAGEVCSRRQ
jgi:hypothetical protein